MNRVSGMGLNGMAASTIGFVMLGCIAIGYFAGSWVDRKFGTTWGIPAGSFIGMAAGFVEMFRTLRQIGKSTKWPSGGSSSGEPGAVSGNGSQAGNGVSDTASAGDVAPQKPPVRQRLFEVPPPPLPEYGAKAQKVVEPSERQVAERLHEDSNETIAKDDIEAND